METGEVIYSRRTIRKFKKEPLPASTVKEILRAAIQAPSSLNSQPWFFYVISGEKRDKLVDLISDYPFFLSDLIEYFPVFSDPEFIEYANQFAKDLGGAPVVIVVTMPRVESDYVRKTQLIACGAAIQNLFLAAWEKGIGGVCLTSASFVEEKILDFLNLSDQELVTLVPLGYPDEMPEGFPRDESKIYFIEE